MVLEGTVRKNFQGLAPFPDLAHGRRQLAALAERAEGPTTAAGPAGDTPTLLSLVSVIPGTGPAII